MTIKKIAIGLAVTLLISCASNGDRKQSQNSKYRTELVDQVRSDSPEMVNVELGVGYLKRGRDADLDVAIGKFKKAVKINPKFALAHSMLAHAYDRKALFDDAEKHYKLSMKYNNNSPDIINNYANFLCQRKKYNEAIDLYMTVVKDPQYSTPAVAYENAGICMKGSGDLQTAENYFRQALDINGKLPNSLYNLMQIYLSKSNFMKARAFLQRLEQTVSPTAEILAAGYKIEAGLDHQDLADKYYSTLKTNFPNSEIYKNLK
jgi:type IV pilus assembly protein PilF